MANVTISYLNDEFEGLREKHYFHWSQFGSIWPTNIDEICAAANNLIDDMIDKQIQKIESEVSEFLKKTIDEHISELNLELGQLWEKFCGSDEINGVIAEYDDEFEDEYDPSKVCAAIKYPWKYGPVHCPRTAINCAGCPYYSPEDEDE